MIALNHGVALNHLLPLLCERNVPDDLAILVISLIDPMQAAGRVIWLLVDKHFEHSFMGCFFVCEFSSYWRCVSIVWRTPDVAMFIEFFIVKLL